MPLPPTPTLRLAIVQPTMHWTGGANTEAILAWLSHAARAGAHIACFPELAVTGFHRQIASQAQPDKVAAWVETIQAACRRLNIAATLGAPSFAPDGAINNSHLLIDAQGQVAACVPKRGLTAPEATFFAPGTTRPLGRLHGHRCSAVICREVEDLEAVCTQLGASALACEVAPAPSPVTHILPGLPVQAQPLEILFWPGLMGPEIGHEDEDPPRHVRQAQDMARRTGAWMVQANWPMALNDPERDAYTGGSVVIHPEGAILLKLPLAAVGMAVFTLGEARFDWTPGG